MATTERSLAIASSSAWPKGSTRLGWQTTSAAATQRATCVVRDAADDADPRPALEGVAQRAVADEREPALAEALEGAREPHHVLALVSEPTQRKAGPSPFQSSSARAARGSAPLEQPEVDAAVDHLGLAARLRDPRLELRAEVVGDGDERGCAAGDGAGGRPDARDRADVADVVAVRGHDERCARRERGEQARRDEEVGVDDVRPEAAGGPRQPSRRGSRSGACRRRGVSSTARSSSCPRSSSASAICLTKTPRSGASGPGYICETSRIFTRARSSTLSVRMRHTPARSPGLGSRVVGGQRPAPEGPGVTGRRTFRTRRGGRCRSRRPCSGRAAPRASAVAGCSSPRGRARTSSSAASAASASRSARTRAVRSSWRCSAAGSRRCSSIGSASCLRVLVHADDHALARLDLLVVAERRLLDLPLDEAALDRLDRAAELLDLVDQLQRPRLELVGQRSR